MTKISSLLNSSEYDLRTSRELNFIDLKSCKVMLAKDNQNPIMRRIITPNTSSIKYILRNAIFEIIFLKNESEERRKENSIFAIIVIYSTFLQYTNRSVFNARATVLFIKIHLLAHAVKWFMS